MGVPAAPAPVPRAGGAEAGRAIGLRGRPRRPWERAMAAHPPAAPPCSRVGPGGDGPRPGER